MTSPVAKSPVAALLERFLPRLRYPHLFALIAGLLAVDLLLPDPIPLIDEVTLALLTLLVGSWRNRREEPRAPKDVTPRDEEPPALPPSQ